MRTSARVPAWLGRARACAAYIDVWPLGDPPFRVACRACRRNVVRLFGLVLLLLSCACGRLGFDALPSSSGTDDVLDISLSGDGGGDAAEPDAGRPLSTDAGSDRGPSDGGEVVHTLMADAGLEVPDAGRDPGQDAGTPFSCTSCTLGHPACPEGFAARLWPVAAQGTSCRDGAGNAMATLGVGAADYTFYGGCPSWVEFDTTSVSELYVRATGDGCGCSGCSLWHVHYELQESVGGGLAAFLEVQEPDLAACTANGQIRNEASYVPRTDRVRLQGLPGSSGSGFYYLVCAR